MTKVLVLCGGKSDERDVSLRSGASVKAALKKVGYQVGEFDPVTDYTADNLAGYDVVFPVLHGAGGEDGTVQALLEDLGVRYVGTGSAASALCFDKWRYKQLLLDNELLVPQGELVDESAFWQSELIKGPFVLKPNDGGSSVDTILMREQNPKIDRAGIKDLFSRHRQLLLEELIEGTEITVAVLGEQALPVIEIIPPADSEFDYENKYNGRTQEICPPRNVPLEIQTGAQSLAATIHKLTGCRDMSRTDMIINKNKELYVLETNTIPGMTDQSLFPKAARAAGIEMTELVDRLVKSALAR